MSNKLKLISLSLIFLLCECKNSNDMQKVYYDNGNLKEELILKNELKNGYCKFFFENGNISHDGEYNNKWGIRS